MNQFSQLVRRGTLGRFRGFAGMAVVAVMLVCVASVASATTIPYGTYNGDNVDFIGVQEDSLFSPPYYGAPTVSGDSLFFTPLSFGATSAGGGISLVDGSVISGIMASSTAIQEIHVSEFGDYSLFGQGTDATSAAISTIAFLTVLEVDGAGITPFTYIDKLTFTPASATNGTWDLANDAGLGVVWNGHLTLDLSAILASHSIAGSATKVQLRLQNTMAATSQPLSAAFIQKKGVQVDVVVPEPSSVVLAGCGLGVLALCGWRRRQTA